VIDALLLEAPRYQGRAVDFAHAFLLVTGMTSAAGEQQGNPRNYRSLS
jgi:hypothetical protein